MIRNAMLIAVAVCLVVPVVRAQPEPDHFAVTGVAAATTPAEVLRVTITVAAQAETAERAYERAVRRSEDVVTAFRRFGFKPDDYHTRYVVERRPVPGEKNKLAFIAAVGMSLVVDDFSSATQMLDVATGLGVRDFVTFFDIADRRAAYEKALQRAFADARLKAEAMAAEAGIKLGPVAGFEELSQPPAEYEYPQPLVPVDFVEVGEGQVPPPGPGGVRMAPQPYEVRAQVRVAFSIVD